MENQQQPQTVSLAEIANRTFGEQETNIQQELPKLEDTVLPPIPDSLKVEETTTEELKTEDVKKSNNKFSERIQMLIEDGFLEDYQINVDDQDVYLSEVIIEDKETYDDIIKKIKSEKEKANSENYISKEGLDETTQKLIEIKKAGGDITEILQENVHAINKLINVKNLLDSVETEDKDKEQLAINIIAEDLRNRDLEDEVIQAQLRVYINKGELEERANKILDTHISLHSKAIDEKQQETLEKLEKEKEELKNFKKNLSNKYKEEKLPEALTKVLVENATKLDQFKMSNTDKLYFEASQNNPELFAEVNFLLNNREKFKEWIGGKKATQGKAEILSGIRINTNKKKEVNTSNHYSLEDIASRE